MVSISVPLFSTSKCSVRFSKQKRLFFNPIIENVIRVGFVQSSFRGQLPQYYAEVNGTSVILPHFNDQNKEEPSRYVTSIIQIQQGEICEFYEKQKELSEKLEGNQLSGGHFDFMNCRYPSIIATTLSILNSMNNRKSNFHRFILSGEL